MPVISFDLPAPSTEQTGSAGGPLVPKGRYSAKVDQWKEWPLGPTFNGPESEKIGTRYATSYTITEGPHAGRFVRDGFNISMPWNLDKQKQEQARLAALFHAVGMPACRDTDETTGAELIIEVDELAAKGDFKARNMVKNYIPISGAKPAAAPATRAVPSFLAGKKA